tara:strand:+ start:60 stop:1133 length:1074 start_codon:yes stop_codon:yes gene_type:complete
MARYHPDDIIRLAQVNQGFGFRRFLAEIHGKGGGERGGGNESQTLRLFEIHKLETGEDLFAHLQDPSQTQMVTRREYHEITGLDRAPMGSGLSTSRRSGADKGSHAKDVPLPPQEFNWLDVSELEGEWRGETNHITLIDFKSVVAMYDEEMMDVDQISEETGVGKGKLASFIEDLQEYDEYDVVERWLGVLQRLWVIQCHRGKDHLEDELMMDFRGIFKDYVNDPVNTEAPTLDDVDWVYSQLLSEERQEDVYPEEIDLDLVRRQTIERAEQEKGGEHRSARLAGFSSVGMYRRSLAKQKRKKKEREEREGRLAGRYGRVQCRKCKTVLYEENSYRGMILNNDYVCKRCHIDGVRGG